METLVDHKSVKISVKDTAGYTVCIKCKGGRTRSVFDYYNSNALVTGGLYAVSHSEQCPHCNGKGFWKNAEA